MPKWEYGSLLVAAGILEGEVQSKIIAVTLTLPEGNRDIAPTETKGAMSELNKLGNEGWELVSVIANRSDNGIANNYILKRPKAE